MRVHSETLTKMATEHKRTEFAPAPRAPSEVVRKQAGLLDELPLLQELYDAVSEAVMVLNPQRQIVFCNRRLLDMLGAESAADVHGLRPGEAVGCIYAERNAAGCGTSEYCSACGAVNAVLCSFQGEESVRECHILRGSGGEALDLLVRATPFALDGERFSILAVRDIGQENRLKALERVFFHDLMNSVVALRMLSRRLSEGKAEDAVEVAETISRGLAHLQEEIASHRDLIAAETDGLQVVPRKVRSLELVRKVVETHRAHAAGRRLKIDPASADVEFTTDPGVVSRVLGNMIKNAVEASEADGTVTVGCEADDGEVRFWVHNDGVMPRDVQLQVFQRSFSTKGAGRGLGTYSMKLLTEKYLNGRVEFISSDGEGTVFRACYPLNGAA